MQPNITVDHDKVVIEGVSVPRPASLSPSQWIDAWEKAVAAMESDEEGA